MKKYILTFIIGGISFANILAASNGVYNITVSHEYIGIDAKHLTKATSTTTIDIRNAQGGAEKPFVRHSVFRYVGVKPGFQPATNRHRE